MIFSPLFAVLVILLILLILTVLLILLILAVLLILIVLTILIHCFTTPSFQVFPGRLTAVPVWIFFTVFIHLCTD